MQVLNYKELTKFQELNLDITLYALNCIRDFQNSDEHFYNSDDTFKNVFWGIYELFIIDDNGYKGCCVTKLQLSTKGDYYIDIVFCIGEFKDKFIEYLSKLRSKIQDVYKNDKPIFYKIDGRLGWSKYFKELDMVEMSRTYVGSFNYGE